MLYNGITIRAANEAMKLYIKGTSCRRRELYYVILITSQLLDWMYQLDIFVAMFVEKVLHVQVFIVMCS